MKSFGKKIKFVEDTKKNLDSEARKEENKEELKKWWWKSLWKLKGPLKNRIFLWLALSRKVLSWDKCNKRTWQGPRRCILCKKRSWNYYLLVHCTYTKEVWYDARKLTYGKGRLFLIVLKDGISTKQYQSTRTCLTLLHGPYGCKKWNDLPK